MTRHFFVAPSGRSVLRLLLWDGPRKYGCSLEAVDLIVRILSRKDAEMTRRQLDVLWPIVRKARHPSWPQRESP